MANGNQSVGHGSDDAQRQSYPGKGNPGAKGKEKSDKAGDFAKGGSTHMITGTSAGPQKPGQSASEGRSSDKIASGGNGHMFGKQYANPQEPGCSGHDTKSGNSWGVEGGKGPHNHMFGRTGSTPAKPA